VIVTSSTYAISGGRSDKQSFNEGDWGLEEKVPAYIKSKVLAEKAAWEIYNKHKELKLTTILPGLI